jgi:hypothetical protein
MFACAWMSGASVLLVFQLTALADPAAPAVSADEQQAFAQGLRLYESGDARGAEREWRAGYAVHHDAAFLVRIGEAEERAAAPAEAIKTYERYLRESPTAADREEIEGRISRLDPHRAGAGPGAHTAAAGATDDDASPAPSSSAPSQGKPAEGATAGAASPAADSRSGAARARRQQAEDLREDPREDLRSFVTDEPARSRLNVAAWVGTAVTVALLGVAAFYGASASEKEGDINRLLAYRNDQTGVPVEYATVATTFEEDTRLGRRDNRIAKGLALAAGGTALASAVLFVIDGLRGAPDGVTPRLAFSISNEAGAHGLGVWWSLRR